MLLGDELPNLALRTLLGDEVQLYNLLSNRWTVIVTLNANHPVSCSELIDLWNCEEEFSKRKVALLALVPSAPEVISNWLKDVQIASGVSSEITSFPILSVSRECLEDCIGKQRSPESFLPLGTLVVGGDHQLKLSSVYPHNIGRKVEEILRSVLAVIVTCQRRVVTPVDWDFKAPCIVVPGLTEEEIREEFPGGVHRIPMPSGLDYMAFTKSSLDF